MGEALDQTIKTTKSLQCTNLYEYLKTLPKATLDKLYTHSIICLAVYRDLPDVAKHYVIRLLFVEQPVPQAVIASWLMQNYSKEHNNVANVLSDLHVWQEVSIPGGLPAWFLNPVFKKNFKCALVGGGHNTVTKANLETDSKARDVDYLDKYAMERWECVLHYMVGSQQQEGISADAVRILLHAGLMRRDEEDGSPVITKEGFQFLLLDTPAQVWYFMLQYLGTVESRGLDLVQCLAFLFQLSFSILGKDYSTDGMNEGLLTFLQHLREFGLVYQRKRKGGKYYPTRLALNITCKNSTSEISTKEGYIIVESNYRVYAYTNSNLKVALIGLFTEMLYRFPNMCVGTLTRDSICMALRSGITAEQIIGFLKLHAHPRMLANTGHILPPTITDQINLWEKERDRFQFTEGILYSQFLSHNDFSILRDFALEHNLIIWQDDKKRTMVVSKHGHDEVKKFWKKHSKGSSHSMN
ncbi:general transcription factor IIH subunit 4 [Cimex lectularius]|uniref:General transcription factor IIH subunit 4 n=1 Tax=Cimex lectularius TaxID=79782 RepID=A0A8I6RGS5_CIMLE|nr:general transcription factor IIH subunit 4 [Cimex lectularius]XP_014241774.1 general transcription factor IIH subunit 4 [Cimex lectularius]